MYFFSIAIIFFQVLRSFDYFILH